MVVQRVWSMHTFVAKVVSGLYKIEIYFPYWLIVWEIRWKVVIRLKPFLVAVSLLGIWPEKLKIKFYEPSSFLVLRWRLEGTLSESVVVSVQNVFWTVPESRSNLVVIWNCLKLPRSNLNTCVQLRSIRLNCLKLRTPFSVSMQVKTAFVVNFAIKFAFEAYLWLLNFSSRVANRDAVDCVLKVLELHYLLAAVSLNMGLDLWGLIHFV